MDTILGDHRSVMDNNMGRSLSRGKKVSIDTHTSPYLHPDVRSAIGHKSWADVVKSVSTGLPHAHPNPLLRQ